MQVTGSASGFACLLERARAGGGRVGLVPTMGSLHAGHLSLAKRARCADDLVALTIFVNPLQFGPGEDLAQYPRDPEADLEAAEAAGADLVFAPDEAEMYPDPPLVSVGVGVLGQVLEGASRPGHLEGVATVVAKLFALAGRTRSYFGEKDYQQLLVVRRLVKDLSFPVEVVACPTVREPDGLALSSRNARLSPTERGAATALVRGLEAGREALRRGAGELAEVEAAMAAVVEAEPLARLDYAAVRRDGDLSLPERLEGRVRLLAAARVGPVRLIDNLGLRIGGEAPA